MNSVLVGFENLPNVYITDIYLENDSTENYVVDFNIQVIDVYKNGESVWHSNEDLKKYMKVGLITTKSVALINQLRGGSINPHPLSVIKSDSFDQNSDIKSYPMIEFMRRDNGTDIKFDKRVQFKESYTTENLSIFCFSYLDTQQISLDYGIDLGGNLKTYTGALIGERIMQDGALVDRTTIFLNKDNTVWSGPVHYHNGSPMAGSFHSDKPHASLKTMVTKNYKLIDNRKETFDLRKDRDSKNDVLFSNLYHSINSDVDLYGVFSFNVKQFAIQKTDYGRKLHQLNNSFFQEYLSTIKINSLSIIRQQIKIGSAYNSVGTLKKSTKNINSYEYVDTTVDETPGKLRNQENLREIYITQNPLIRHFQFFDTKQDSHSKGIFKYRMEMTIVDNSQQFVNRKIVELQNSLAELENFVFRYNSPRSYDYRQDRLKNNVNIPGSILKIIGDYYNKKSYLYNIPVSKIKRLIETDTKKFLNANYKASTGEKFLNEYKALVTEFRNKFNVSINQKTGKDRPKTNRSSTIPNLVHMNKEFEQIIDFEDYRRFYDFLNINKNIKSPITKEEYLNRGAMEVDRFFDTSKSITISDFKNIKSDVKSAIMNLERPKYKFLTPVKFQFEKQKVNLTDLDKINKASLFTLFNRSNKREKLRKSRKNIRMRSIAEDKTVKSNKRDRNGSKRSKPIYEQRVSAFSFTLKTPDKTIKQLKKNLNIGSNIYLGNNSEFPFIDGDNKLAINPRFKKNITDSLDSALDVSIPRSKTRFDIGKPNNFIDDYLKRRRFSLSFLKKAPICWKALVLSKSKSARNNILKEDVDVLQDSTSKVATEMLFQSAQVVEVLAGYQKDKHGVEILSQPRWVEFDEGFLNDTRATICRLRYIEMPEIGLSPLEMFKLPVVNSTFIISERPLQSDITTKIISPTEQITMQTNINSKNEVSKNIKYAHSIIIEQSADKDAFRRIQTGREATSPATEVSAPTSNPRETSSGTRSRRMSRNINRSGGSSGGGGY